MSALLKFIFEAAVQLICLARYSAGPIFRSGRKSLTGKLLKQNRLKAAGVSECLLFYQNIARGDSRPQINFNRKSCIIIKKIMLWQRSKHFIPIIKPFDLVPPAANEDFCYINNP